MLATQPPMAVNLFWKPASADPSEIGPYHSEPADKFTVTKGLTLVELHQKATLHEKKDAFIPELWNMAEASCGMDVVWFPGHLDEDKQSGQAGAGGEDEVKDGVKRAGTIY